MHDRSFSQALLSLLTTLLLLCGTSLAFADSSTSTSFMTRQSINNTFGGAGTSTSFKSVGTGGEQATGESTSSNFVLDSGTMYSDTFTPKTSRWRWYGDYSAETPSSPLSSEDVAAPSVENGTTVKLRVDVRETAGFGESGAKFRLQYSTSSDFSSGGYDVAESGACSGSSSWCYANGGGVDGAIISTKLLTDADPCTGSTGTGCGTHNESGTSASTFTQAKNTRTEYEFTILESGALTSTVYFFRLYDVAGGAVVPLYGTSTFPSLSTGGTSLSFSIDGIATSTSTGGVTTDFSSSATAVPFGALDIGQDAIGAQRLTVSTNATGGYEIYAIQQQGLLGEEGTEITPVNGTNPSPASWTGGCASTSTGCYGYHTTEAVLSGGSTRFAADDTYAGFSTTTLDEIAYSVNAALDRSTDMVYKVEVHGLQASGDYSSSLSYIVVPTF